MSIVTSHLDVETLSIAVIVVLVVGCTATDIYQRRIPNFLTFPAAALGLALAFVGSGWRGLLLAELGLAIGLGLLFIPYFLGGMGAGDVKFVAAVGALVSFPGIIHVCLYTAIIGGAIAMIVALRHHVALDAISNIMTLLINKRLGQVLARKASSRMTKSVGTIPYGIAIGLGTITYLICGPIL